MVDTCSAARRKSRQSMLIHISGARDSKAACIVPFTPYQRLPKRDPINICRPVSNSHRDSITAWGAIAGFSLRPSMMLRTPPPPESIIGSFCEQVIVDEVLSLRMRPTVWARVDSELFHEVSRAEGSWGCEEEGTIHRC
jgi:hypothetical protein